MLHCKVSETNKLYTTVYNIPTQVVCSSLGTSSPIEHIKHLLSKDWIDPSGQTHTNGSPADGILSPGQMPKSEFWT